MVRLTRQRRTRSQQRRRRGGNGEDAYRVTWNTPDRSETKGFDTEEKAWAFIHKLYNNRAITSMSLLNVATRTFTDLHIPNL